MSEGGPTAYCTRCGAETAPGALSCSACGAPILGAVGDGESAPVPGGDAQGSPRRGFVVGALALVLVLAVGIGVYLATKSGDDQQTSPVPTTNASSPPNTSTSARTATCESASNGYSLEYPADWQVEKTHPVWACALFDPQPFTLEPDTETPLVAVQIYDERSITFADMVTGLTDPASYQVLKRRDTTVAGLPAVVLETVQLCDELLTTAGTYNYQYVVDRSGGIVLAFTTGQPGSPYDQYRTVLDEMMASLRFKG